MAAALTMQPILVQVKADLPSFEMYISGVYDDSDCTSVGIDHSMLLIGYGTTDEGIAYWILKNSWGKSVSCNNRVKTNIKFSIQIILNSLNMPFCYDLMPWRLVFRAERIISQSMDIY